MSKTLHNSGILMGKPTTPAEFTLPALPSSAVDPDARDDCLPSKHLPNSPI